MIVIRQTDDGWQVVEIRDGEESVLAVFDGRADDDAAQRRAYILAVQWLADSGAVPAPVSPDGTPQDGTAPAPTEPPPGALSDRWQAAAQGIVANAPTGDGRDFTDCVWSWRATVAPLPLMLLTETTYGHNEAEVAGWIDTQGDPTIAGAVQGWFHDSEAGRQARDILAAQGAFSVSVDPGEVTATFICLEEEIDEWGSYCIDGMLNFQTYEIAGLTMVPWPGFASAAIELVPAAAVEPVPVEAPIPVADAAPVAAAAVHPDVKAALDTVNADRVPPVVTAAVSAARRPVPPAEWFEMTEPDDSFDGYIDQRDGQRGVPLTITDDGHVYGHLGLWGTCHVGISGECVTPPKSVTDYAHYHLGVTRTAEGTDVATGAMVAGADHAALRLRAPEATDWYAHNGVAWADVRASNGQHGAWASGALRPDVTDDQVRVLRAGALSGDWRDRGSALDLIAVLAVSTPGFPIIREALAAAAFPIFDGSALGYQLTEGRQTALVAAGIVWQPTLVLEALVAAGTVERCEKCGRAHRTAASRIDTPDQILGSMMKHLAGIVARQGAVIDRIDTVLRAVDIRTRPLGKVAAAEARERLSGRNGR